MLVEIKDIAEVEVAAEYVDDGKIRALFPVPAVPSPIDNVTPELWVSVLV